MCRQAPREIVSRAVSLNNVAKKINIETIVSQNVRGLKSDARLDELFCMIKSRNILAACLQETWRSGSEIIEYEQCRLITTGLDAADQCSRGSQGVGIALNVHGVEAWKAAGSVVHQNFGARVLAVRLLMRDVQQRDVGLFIVSAYAPVGNADEQVWDDYFQNLSDCIARKPNNDILIVGSDTNSSMGVIDNTIDYHRQLGRFGLKHRNNAGERFSSYLAINNLVSLTTCFRKSQYGTWVHPRSKLPHQIDHIIVANEYFCRFTDAGLAPVLLDSDHRAVYCKLRVMARLKKRTPQRTRLLRSNYDCLANNDIADTFCKRVVDTYSSRDDLGEAKYTRLAKSITVAALQTLPVKEKAQPGWFSAAESQIMPLIESRNSAMEALFKRHTRSTHERLRCARQVLKRTVDQAKSTWIAKQCTDINTAMARGAGTKRCWDAVSALRQTCHEKAARAWVGVMDMVYRPCEGF